MKTVSLLAKLLSNKNTRKTRVFGPDGLKKKKKKRSITENGHRL